MTQSYIKTRFLFFCLVCLKIFKQSFIEEKMWFKIGPVSTILLSLVVQIFVDGNNKNDDLKFPPDFMFGAASAAYQVEGAWNVDGRQPSVWDSLVHLHPNLIVDNSTGDVSANSYEFYNEDVKALKEVGLNFYRFSISWSRILPDGDISSRNQKGIDYYNRLIDTLLANNIQPMVTMFHWDLPQALQDLGGMMNPMIVKFFEVYSDVLFQEFGDRVKYWITFNEPTVSCLGYEDASHPPLIALPGVGQYLCQHHVLLSHTAAYRLYKNYYQSEFKGKVGITLCSLNYYKKNADDSDEVVDRAMQFELGAFLHPIFSQTGGYPAIMIEEVGKNSLVEGRFESRLPKFSEVEKTMVQGSADFLGFNYYSSRFAEIDVSVKTTDPPSLHKDAKILLSVNATWPKGKSSWLYSVPTGLRDALRWIKNEYRDPEIWITENGWSDDGELNDVGRTEYYRLHLREALKSISLDTVKLRGYAFWSIIDNFEWLRGYTEKFGLYQVNFTSPNKERTPKDSSKFLHQVIQTRKVPI